MDELEMLRRFRRTVSGPTESTRAAARAMLLAHIDGTPARRRPSISSVFRRRVIPAIIMAGALVVAWSLVIAPLLTGGQSASAAAARVLRAAAHRASLQPLHVLRPGEYAYTRSEGAYFDQQDRQGKTWGALVRTAREIWIGSDGSGRIRQHSDTPIFPGPADRARWLAAGSPSVTELSTGETYDRRFGVGGLGPPLHVDGLQQNNLLRLAGNPDALASAIRAIAEQNPNPLNWEKLTIVGDLLAESVAPPQLRASLFTVASTIPDIELVGTVRDRAGRTGIAVAANRGDERLELIFDPATSLLLAQQQTLLRRVDWIDAPAGTPIAYTLYLESKVTPSASSAH